MRIRFLIGCVLLAACSCVGAEVVLLGASKDATIYSSPDNVNNSNGAGPGFFAGADGVPQSLRGLIQFDIADNIPAGATINSVQLTLVLGMAAGTGGVGSGTDETGRAIELHRLSYGWGEGTTGSSNTAIGGTGRGFAANPGDATWTDRLWGSSPATATPWNTVGGDFTAAASGSAIVTSVAGNAYSWNSTPGMVADVQSWLNDSADNDGWILLNTDETGTRTFRAFWTREASDPSLRPQLQVNFTPVPEPAVFLPLIGLCALDRRRRRRST